MHNSGDSTCCLFHSTLYHDEFQHTINQLKGTIIPGRIVKRAGYLVCDCCKKHTKLDDAYTSLDLENLERRLAKAIKTTSDAINVCSTKENNVITSEPEEKTCDKYEKDHGVLDEGQGQQLPSMISDCFHGEASAASCIGLRRLLVILDRCLEKNTNILEPRSLQLEKKREMRDLKRGKFFKKIKKIKYVSESVTLSHPSITSSMLVGKRGCNIRSIIAGNMEIRISISDGPSPGVVRATVRAKDISQVQTAKSALFQMHQSLIKAKKAYQERREMRKYLRDVADDDAVMGDDMKDIARDQFERKSSHQMSRSPPDRSTSSKPKVLDKDNSRCLNCLTHYDTSADGATACKYHPGYIDQHLKWTCCTRTFKAGQHASTTAEGKRLGHKHNGCARARHNWRLHKTTKCSGRKSKCDRSLKQF